MTIGDVLAFIAGISGLGICAWAVMVCIALVFPRKAGAARELISDSPWSCLFLGLGLLAVGGFFSVVLLSIKIPMASLFGWMIMTMLLAFAGSGASGFALLAGARIRMMDDRMTDYQALSRGAAVVFIAALTPVLGTFLIAPAGIAISLGAGVRALLSKADAPRFEIA